MEKMKAKLVNATIREPFYFSEYEYECIKCGAHYRRHAYNSRISPYCAKCSQEIDSIKNKERAARKKNEAIIKELEKIKTEMTDLDIVSTNGNNAKQVFFLTKDLMISIVENHISELKGDKECTQKK